MFGRPIGVNNTVSAAHGMNDLGLGAFNTKAPAASTFCYVLSLNIPRQAERDDITFGVAVANAVDDAFDSALCGRVYFVDINGKEVCDHVPSK